MKNRELRYLLNKYKTTTTRVEDPFISINYYQTNEPTLPKTYHIKKKNDK